MWPKSANVLQTLVVEPDGPPVALRLTVVPRNNLTEDTVVVKQSHGDSDYGCL